MNDIQTRRAARIFGVKPSEVTKDQREVAKTIYFGRDFGTQGSTFPEFLQGVAKMAERKIETWDEAEEAFDVPVQCAECYTFYDAVGNTECPTCGSTDIVGDRE